MAENYDGSVVIKTGLDLETIQKDAETLKKAIEAATTGAKQLAEVAKTSGAAQIAMLKQANAGWTEQLRILQQIKDIMGGSFVMPTTQTRTTPRSNTTPGAEDVQVETKEYAELRKELEAIGKQLDANAQKQQKMIDLAGGVMNVSGKRSYLSLQYDAEMLRDRYDEIQEKMREMEASGGRFAAAPTPALDGQARSVTKLTTKYERLATVTKTAQKEAVKTTKAVAHHGGVSFKNILKYAFGIRSMFFLMRKIRAVAKEALKVMASYDPELNGVISKLMTSVKQLKADFGTMIQPLVQNGAPVLTWLLNKLHAVANGVAQFIAALSGQNYIEVATVDAVEYADSLDDVAESAEKALGSYDKLNVMQDNSKNVKNTLALTKDTVKYTKQALDNDSWTVKLGRRLHEIWQDAKEAVNDIMDRLGKAEWFQKMKKKLTELLNDPDKLLISIGVVGLGIKLGKMLAAKMLTGMSEGGLTSGITGLLPKALTIAATIVIGYKIGNKIYEELPDELKDLLGERVNDFFENPIETVVDGLKETYDALKEEIEQLKKEEQKTGGYSKDNSLLKNTWEYSKSFFGVLWDWITNPSEMLEEVSENVDNEMTTVKTKTKSKVKEGIDAFNKASQDFKQSVDNWFVEIVEEAKENVKTALGIVGIKPAETGETRKPREEKPKYSVSFTQEEIEELDRLRKEAFDKIMKQLEPLKVQFEYTFEAKHGVSLKDALAKIKSVISTGWNSKENPVKQTIETIKNAFSSLWNGIFKPKEDDTKGKTFSDKLTSIGKFLKTTWNDKGNPVKTDIGTIKTSFQTLWKGIFTVGSGGLSAVQLAAMKLNLATIKAKIKELWDAKTNPIKEYISSIKTSFKTMWNNLFNVDEKDNKQNVPEFKVTDKQKLNVTKQGKILGASVLDGFKDAINSDKTMDQTIIEKVTRAIMGGYNTASIGNSVIQSAIANGTLKSNTKATFTTTTQKNGDIVLTLDGKVVAKSVWDNTTKQYKQTGTSLLLN